MQHWCALSLREVRCCALLLGVLPPRFSARATSSLLRAIGRLPRVCANCRSVNRPPERLQRPLPSTAPSCAPAPSRLAPSLPHICALCMTSKAAILAALLALALAAPRAAAAGRLTIAVPSVCETYSKDECVEHVDKCTLCHAWDRVDVCFEVRRQNKWCCCGKVGGRRRLHRPQKAASVCCRPGLRPLTGDHTEVEQDLTPPSAGPNCRPPSPSACPPSSSRVTSLRHRQSHSPAPTPTASRSRMRWAFCVCNASSLPVPAEQQRLGAAADAAGLTISQRPASSKNRPPPNPAAGHLRGWVVHLVQERRRAVCMLYCGGGQTAACRSLQMQVPELCSGAVRLAGAAARIWGHTQPFTNSTLSRVACFCFACAPLWPFCTLLFQLLTLRWRRVCCEAMVGCTGVDGAHAGRGSWAGSDRCCCRDGGMRGQIGEEMFTRTCVNAVSACFFLVSSSNTLGRRGDLALTPLRVLTLPRAGRAPAAHHPRHRAPRCSPGACR